VHLAAAYVAPGVAIVRGRFDTQTNHYLALDPAYQIGHELLRHLVVRPNIILK
jgi:hypothetical protein